MSAAVPRAQSLYDRSHLLFLSPVTIAWTLQNPAVTGAIVGGAEQVLETALRGAAAGQAEIVILDLTGLKGIDAEVVGKLTRMAGGLRLLGTGVVISGVRPEMARMLVEMDVTLQGIVTCGTLQSGIAYALRRKA